MVAVYFPYLDWGSFASAALRRHHLLKCYHVVSGGGGGRGKLLRRSCISNQQGGKDLSSDTGACVFVFGVPPDRVGERVPHEICRGGRLSGGGGAYGSPTCDRAANYETIGQAGCEGAHNACTVVLDSCEPECVTTVPGPHTKESLEALSVSSCVGVHISYIS